MIEYADGNCPVIRDRWQDEGAGSVSDRPWRGVTIFGVVGSEGDLRKDPSYRGSSEYRRQINRERRW
eukprot:7610510-Alexandrium_andersonii.AAC.1